MTEYELADADEYKRRESFLRSGRRPFNLYDPYTWEYRYKTAAFIAALSVGSMHMSNLWLKKPWHFGIVPRVIGIAAVTGIGYGLGVFRERHNQTRDAVIEHYISLHPEDFDHFKDFNGRPFSQILLPWYPKRTQYRKYD